MEEYLEQIGITQPGFYARDNTYVVVLNDSNDYGKAYSKLERWPELNEIEESSITTHEMSSIQYESKDYVITLVANLDDDEYKVIIRNKGRNEN